MPCWKCAMQTTGSVSRMGICLALLALLAPIGIGRAQNRENPTKEDLIRKLECQDDQACQPPPVSHRRGFQPPQGRRGFTFQPFTEEDRKKIDDAAKAGKLPSADLEIFFDYDKADITALAREALGPLGQAMIDPKLSGSRFVLVGHTDAKGGDAYNQVLSERRAAAVKDYLVRTFGIAPERLVSYGRGKSLLKNSTDPFAAENRRVQVINNGLVAGGDQP
jgi:outer membrane protein OmpA-like peptidoglycan-associated protein